MVTTTAQEWNQHYIDGNTPWDNGTPDSQMQQVFADYNIQPCRMLELGCGTGTNAVWLAQRRFDVTAFDISALAIEKAKARAQAAGVNINFIEASVFALPDLGAPFPLVFDRGVYHCARRLGAKELCEIIARLTAPGGTYYTLAGNAQEPHDPNIGPPRLTAKELIDDFSPWFDLVDLREGRFDPVVIEGVTTQPLAWSALWRRKTS
jgi:SAM-dependent methyltransferase